MATNQTQCSGFGLGALIKVLVAEKYTEECVMCTKKYVLVKQKSVCK